MYLFHSFESAIVTTLILLRLHKGKIKPSFTCIIHMSSMCRGKLLLSCASPNLLEWEEITICWACDKQSVHALLILYQYVNLFRSMLFKSGAITWQYIDTDLIEIYVQLKLRKQGR